MELFFDQFYDNKNCTQPKRPNFLLCFSFRQPHWGAWCRHLHPLPPQLIKPHILPILSLTYIPPPRQPNTPHILVKWKKRRNPLVTFLLWGGREEGTRLHWLTGKHGRSSLRIVTPRWEPRDIGWGEGRGGRRGSRVGWKPHQDTPEAQ